MEKVPPMVDMRHTSAEKEEEAEEYSLPSPSNVPDYPYGLAISLGKDELEKLGLDHTDFDLGDLVHFHAMAMVTSISSRADNMGDTCRIELQITHLSAEDEAEEDEENEEQEDAPSRLYKL